MRMLTMMNITRISVMTVLLTMMRSMVRSHIARLVLLAYKCLSVYFSFQGTGSQSSSSTTSVLPSAPKFVHPSPGS